MKQQELFEGIDMEVIIPPVTGPNGEQYETKGHHRIAVAGDHFIGLKGVEVCRGTTRTPRIVLTLKPSLFEVGCCYACSEDGRLFLIEILSATTFRYLIRGKALAVHRFADVPGFDLSDWRKVFDANENPCEVDENGQLLAGIDFEWSCDRVYQARNGMTAVVTSIGLAVRVRYSNFTHGYVTVDGKHVNKDLDIIGYAESAFYLATEYYKMRNGQEAKFIRYHEDGRPVFEYDGYDHIHHMDGCGHIAEYDITPYEAAKPKKETMHDTKTYERDGFWFAGFKTLDWWLTRDEFRGFNFILPNGSTVRGLSAMLIWTDGVVWSPSRTGRYCTPLRPVSMTCKG